MALEDVLNRYHLTPREGGGWVSKQFCGRVIVVTTTRTKKTKTPLSYEVALYSYDAWKKRVKSKIKIITSTPVGQFTPEWLSSAMEAARRAANTNTRRNHNRRQA
ncbi:MAG: hypothetical protein JNK33_05070 [Candidatus Doudnabacteria bacterium]|nr:hypothetical protein [Candidatus Doudnabacteria bacterium]